jgi:uncharacterized protein YjiS (DUF1127 family)
MSGSEKPTAAIGSPLTVVRAILFWPVRAYAARRVQAQIAAMSERDLQDIGLLRQDTYDAACLPLTADPGRFYAERAVERRQAKTAINPPPLSADLPREQKRAGSATLLRAPGRSARVPG